MEKRPGVLITGSNRGLGLEWVRQYASEGWRIYGTCRHPMEAKDLHDLAEGHSNISIHRLDVTLQDEIHNVAVELMNEPLDLLVNNAGVYLEKYNTIVSWNPCIISALQSTRTIQILQNFRSRFS